MSVFDSQDQTLSSGKKPKKLNDLIFSDYLQNENTRSHTSIMSCFNICENEELLSVYESASDSSDDYKRAVTENETIGTQTAV